MDPLQPIEPVSAAELTPESRTWGMFAHLSSLSGYIGIPLGSVLGPLLVWLIKREQMPFVNDQGKEALNFNLTVAIVGLVGAVLTIFLVGLCILIPLVVFHITITIIAGIAANRGERYRYPLTIRFIS